MDTMLHPPFSYRNIYGKDSNDHSRNRYNPARCDGSMYTPQTTPAIRGKAILYKNPYYKS